MRSIAASLVLLSAGVALAGGTTLIGVVKDSNGKPLAEAIVRLAPTDRSGGYRPVKATTDARGKFELTTEEKGPHSVSVQVIRPGDSFSVDLPEIDVKGAKQKVTLHLTKSEITGKVTCKDTGKPPSDLTKVSVNLYLVKPWSVAGSAFLDEKGSYRLRGFPPGKYRIYVHLDGYRKAETDLEIKKNKKKSGVDFVLEPLKAGRVVFTVKDVDGRPLEGVRFSYSSGKGITSTLKAKADEDQVGVYVCTQLETGAWEVLVSRRDMNVKRVAVSVTEGETSEVTVILMPK